MQYKKKFGFTLIELMITITIVSILAAVALPAYQDYVIRAQVSEGLILAQRAKHYVTEYYADKGIFPSDNNDARFSGETGKFVSDVSIIEDGIIVATFSSSDPQMANEKLNEFDIKLTPEPTDKNNLIWTCLSTAPAKYVPITCQ